MDEIKSIRVDELVTMDFSEITLVDLREPDQVLIGKIEGAVNIPFSRIGKDLDTIPKDKPVFVFCQEGNLSEEVAEILSDRGYDATNITGGYRAWQEVLANAKSIYIDTKGLKSKLYQLLGTAADIANN